MTVPSDATRLLSGAGSFSRRTMPYRIITISEALARPAITDRAHKTADAASFCLQISEFPTGDFGGKRQAVSVETDRPFRSKAAPHAEGVWAPASANRRCGADAILRWSLKASTFVYIV